MYNCSGWRTLWRNFISHSHVHKHELSLDSKSPFPMSGNGFLQHPSRRTCGFYSAVFTCPWPKIVLAASPPHPCRMTRYHDSVVRYQAAPSWVQWCTKMHLFMGHRSKKWKRQLFEVSKSMLENFNNAMYVHPRKNGSEHLCSQKLMLLCASWYWLQRIWICLLQSWKPWTWEKSSSKYLIDCKEYGFALCSLGSLGHEKKVHLNI